MNEFDTIFFVGYIDKLTSVKSLQDRIELVNIFGIWTSFDM